MSPIVDYIPLFVFGGMALGAAGIFGWVHTTKLKIKNGYPLENMWGMPIHPKNDGEAVERVKLITQENAQLRAELGSVKDRMAVIERIVTDKNLGGGTLDVASQIEALRDERQEVDTSAETEIAASRDPAVN